MENFWKLFSGASDSNALTQWTTVALVFLTALLALRLCKTVFLRKLLQKMGLLRAESDGALLSQFTVRLSRPLWLITILLALAGALQFAPDDVQKNKFVIHGPKVAILLAGLWAIDRALTLVFRSGMIGSTLTEGSRYFFLLLSRIIFYIIGLLFILDNLGISITPILASLGVTSLAVALAMKDTLENFFAGVYMLVDKPVRPGDTIQIDATGFIGQVQRIGWRSTHIKMATGNILVIPNTKLATSVITNFSLPTLETSVSCDFGVALGPTLETVESTLNEVVKKTEERCAKVIAGTSTSAIRFNTVTGAGFNVSVIFRLKDVAHQPSLKNEFFRILDQEFRDKSLKFA